MPVDRTTVVGGVWANGAPDPPAAPVPLVTYANSGLLQAAIEAGWPFSKVVDSADFNELMKRMTTLMISLEQQGMLSWSEFTDYTEGARVLGNDGRMYTAIAASTNINPVGNPDKWAADQPSKIVSLTFADSPYDVTAVDGILLVDDSGGDVVLNFLTSETGCKITVKKIGNSANAIKCTPQAAETIEGEAMSFDIVGPGEFKTFVPDGVDKYHQTA